MPRFHAGRAACPASSWLASRVWLHCNRDYEILMFALLLFARATEAGLQKWVEIVLLKEDNYRQVSPHSIMHWHAMQHASGRCQLLRLVCLNVPQLGTEAWSMLKGHAWQSRGFVHALLAQSMTQEADALHALARVMHKGKRAGQLACLLTASVLRVQHVGKL
eukprot:4722131-Pleurochrysis_carterae.AAC.3